MKKLLTVSVLVGGVLALGGPQASAWTNFKLNAGVNLSYIESGNCWLWGAYKSSEYPGTGCGYGYDGYGYSYGYPNSQYGIPGYAAAGQKTPAETPVPNKPDEGTKKAQPVNYSPSWYGQGGQLSIGSYQPMNYGYYPNPSSWYGW